MGNVKKKKKKKRSRKVGAGLGIAIRSRIPKNERRVHGVKDGVQRAWAWTPRKGEWCGTAVRDGMPHAPARENELKYNIDFHKRHARQTGEANVSCP
jgi:hypothetical protein